VRLGEGDRWSVTVTVKAESRHQTGLSGPEGRGLHVTGFEYADQSSDTQQTIRVLYERLTADEPA
jgi:hypothetical protein